MVGTRRSLLVAALVAGALAVPAVASAAPTVVASASPGVPQDCQAGCIQSIRLACTATDPLSVLTTVRCWTTSYNAVSATMAGPAAAAQGNRTSSLLSGF